MKIIVIARERREQNRILVAALPSPLPPTDEKGDHGERKGDEKERQWETKGPKPRARGLFEAEWRLPRPTPKSRREPDTGEDRHGPPDARKRLREKAEADAPRLEERPKPDESRRERGIRSLRERSKEDEDKRLLETSCPHHPPSRCLLEPERRPVRSRAGARTEAELWLPKAKQRRTGQFATSLEPGWELELASASLHEVRRTTRRPRRERERPTPRPRRERKGRRQGRG